jgi:site-specific DNA-methyltransferase (adenine-specific)
MGSEFFFVEVDNKKIKIEQLENGKFKMPAIAKQIKNSFSGMQLKPAVEVVIVAMKPLEEKTYVDQALKNGHGCTWLDDAKIPYESNCRLKKGNSYQGNRNGTNVPSIFNKGEGINYDYELPKGRFPANVLCEDDVLDDGVERKSGAVLTHYKRSGASNLGKTFKIRDRTGEFADWKSNSGGYSRYFSLDAWFAERIKHLPKEAQKTFPWLIVPKASKSEKNRSCEELEKKESNRTNQNWKCSKCNKYQLSSNGDICKCKNPEWSKPKSSNHHPTCKPLKLMSWLITLASREGDIVLDPFCGSGTTCIAAKMLGRQYISIELEKKYYDIARLRINEAQQNMDSFL